MDFHGSRSMDAQGLAPAVKSRPAAPLVTFARFQAGLLASGDFHCILSMPIDFLDFHDFRRWFPLIFMMFRAPSIHFQGFSWISMDPGAWMFKSGCHGYWGRSCCPESTFTQFQAGFLAEAFQRFSWILLIFIDLNWFSWCPKILMPSYWFSWVSEHGCLRSCRDG